MSRGWGLVAGLLLVGGSALAGTAAAQVELRADERERLVAQLELPTVPLARFLVADQDLALWLPSGLEPEGTETGARFVDGEGRTMVALGRHEVLPGASLIQLAETTRADLEQRGLLTEVESRRRLRVAQRPAIELTGWGEVEGLRGPVRVLLAMDPGQGFYRSVFVHQVDGVEPSIDQLFGRLVRDWTPLDGTVWTSTFESLRGELAPEDPEPLAWDARNRVLATIAEPGAIGESEWGEELRRWGERGPGWLIDGLLSPHPRVRMSCIEALDLSGQASEPRIRWLALAVRDSDAAVRLRAALRVVEAELAIPVLDQTLPLDSFEARAAGFQLLASMPPDERSEAVVRAFSDRSLHSPVTRTLLAALTARWGEPERARSILFRAYRVTRDDDFRQSLRRLLLDLGHPDVLAEAREVLREPPDPVAPGELPVDVAASALATHASPEDLEDLKLLGERWSERARRLAEEPASPEDPALESGDRDESLAEAEGVAQVLASVVALLSERPSGAASDDECDRLRARWEPASWTVERARLRGCDAPQQTQIATIAVARLGPYVDSLLTLMEQLDLGSTAYDEMFHSAVDLLERRLEHWAGDPVSMSSTGIDLSAPVGFTLWVDAPGADADSDALAWGGSRIEIKSYDAATFRDTALRLRDQSVGVRELTQGAMGVHGVPLLPAVLFAAWGDAQNTAAAVDDDTSAELPSDRYVGLLSDGAGGGAVAAKPPWTLVELELDAEGIGVWSGSRIGRRDDQVVWTEPIGDLEAARPRSEVTAGSSFEVDLAAFLGLFARGDVEGGADGPAGSADGVGSVPFDLPEDLILAVRTDGADSGEAATELELLGLPESWSGLLDSRSPDELRAPKDLLPADTLAWVGLTLDPSPLGRHLEEHREDLIEELGKRRVSQLERISQVVQGEMGVALLGVPDPRTSAGPEAWKEQLIVYFAVDPEPADRLLRRGADRSRRVAGRRVHEWDELLATRIGEFVVVALDEATFDRLGDGTALAATPLFRRTVERTSGASALLGLLATDRLASPLREVFAAQEDFPSSFMVEATAALGGVGAWLEERDRTLLGEISADPRLHPERDAPERETYVDFVSSSVPTDWPPWDSTAEGPYREIELLLSLPDGLEDPDLAWSNERLDQEALDPGHYRFVSRSGTPLPATSGLTLPIASPDLQTYLRNEHNLGLHLTEVRELAEEIRGDETDPARIVRSIVDWAHESLEYSVIRRSPSIEEILATRRADCTEFSQLTIALARSLGIPARTVRGIHLGREAAILHQWAEVHLDRWYEIDSTWGVTEVPAAHLRLPGGYGGFLASVPGGSFEIGRVRNESGGWTRRLASEVPAADPEVAAIAVVDERVLVLFRDDALARTRALYSADGGASFRWVADLPPAGKLAELVGGQGRLLAILESTEGEGSRAQGEPKVVELGRAGEWESVPLPSPLSDRVGLGSWGVAGDGFLVLAADPDPRLFVLTADLQRAAEVPLPSSTSGPWLLSPHGGALVHVPRRGDVEVHRWSETDGAWGPSTRLEETRSLAVRQVREVGGILEVVLEDSRSKTPVPFALRVEDDQQYRRTWFPPTDSTQTTTSSSGDQWSYHAAPSGHFLTRRPSLD